MQIFRINTNHSFIPKIYDARKNKYEPLKCDKSNMPAMSSYTLYHVSSVIIQDFILIII